MAIATVGQKISGWDRHRRMPVPPPPPGSCDYQFHSYAEPSKFPPRANPPYSSLESATFIEAAPDRIVWGSDWPHPQWRKRMMNAPRKWSFFIATSMVTRRYCAKSW